MTKNFDDFISLALTYFPENFTFGMMMREIGCIEKEQSKAKTITSIVDFFREYIPLGLKPLLDIADKLCLAGVSALLSDYEKSPYLRLTIEDEECLRLQKYNIIQKYFVSDGWETVDEHGDIQPANGLDQVFYMVKGHCEAHVDYYYVEFIGDESNIFVVHKDGLKCTAKLPSFPRLLF